MKAAAHPPRCAADAAPRAHAGIRPSLLTSHLPKRHAVASPDLPELDASPRLTAPKRRAKRAALPNGPADGPRVLHIDSDLTAAVSLATLLLPEARVVHARSVAEAKEILTREIFSLIVIDPSLPDGDAASLLPAMASTPVLVYAILSPEWREGRCAYLPKPWTTHRELWSTISRMLGIAQRAGAGGD